MLEKKTSTHLLGSECPYILNPDRCPTSVWDVPSQEERYQLKNGFDPTNGDMFSTRKEGDTISHVKWKRLPTKGSQDKTRNSGSNMLNNTV